MSSSPFAIFMISYQNRRIDCNLTPINRRLNIF
nr:MAG TPA: hypothetical protein [Caudoviricetes sp.]